MEWILANGEAETHCAWMVKTNNASAVLSEDSDCLAYGVETFLLKPNFSQKKLKKITFSKLLEKLELSQDEFLDFCIMCGTDYNPNMKGIGVKRSYALIQKHRSIDSITADGASPKKLDTAVLKHKVVRKLFTLSDTYDSKKEVVECKPLPINRTEVATFFFQKNMNSNVSDVLQYYNLKK